VRYGTVIAYERAVQAPDPRLRILGQILGYVVASLAMPRAAIATLDTDGRVVTVVMWRAAVDASARRSHYVDELAHGDPLASAGLADPNRTVATIDDVGGRERFLRTVYGGFLTAAGVQLAGAMYLRHHGREVARIGLLRGVGAPDLTREEVAAARRLHPLVEAAYACSLHAPMSPAAPTAEAWFDRARLTSREREVVRVAALGYRNAEIATTLYLGVATVKTHLHHAFVKLGVRSRVELAARLQAIAAQ
jgi:DNA-binding CsgD family transcriptional regulator